MSVEKSLSQADKLFEKGKFEEAIAKYKEAIKLEPNHQQANTKLAIAFAAAEKSDEAVKIFERLAAKASEAGRSQIAVALLKQANDLLPGTISIISKLAVECEATGKFSEANQYSQQVLGHYLARKKYIEALPMCGLLARTSPKEEKIKKIWIELLTNISIEEKLQSALVYFMGPPGLSDKDFPAGGDPEKISESIYMQLSKLLSWYPKSIKLPYALAWAAYKRNQIAEAYGYISEAFRRDPDCTLNLLLFARILVDEQKLNEAYYVYKFAKDKIPIDKTVDTIILNKQLSAFEEKNSWIKLGEDLGEVEQLTPDQYLALFQKKKSTVVPLPTTEASNAEEIMLTPGDVKTITLSNIPLESPVAIEEDRAVDVPAVQESLSPLDMILNSRNKHVSMKEISSPSIFVDMPVNERENLSQEAVPNLENLFNNNTATESEDLFLSHKKDGIVPMPATNDARESAGEVPSTSPPESNPDQQLFDELSTASEEVIDEAPQVAPMEKPIVKFVPIPELLEIGEQSVEPRGAAPIPAAGDRDIDRGSDLLNIPTRAFAQESGNEGNTLQLVEELKQITEINFEVLLKKGERFLAKRNYYLARKSYRRALSLGADPEFVKLKLREIRSLEIPNSLYNTVSSDAISTPDYTESLLSALEMDFEIEECVDNAESKHLFNRTKFQKILKSLSARDCVDLGVAFYEMGLYSDAENIFKHASHMKSDVTFESEYLTAECLTAQKKYAEAVNLLKQLVVNKEKQEEEKISIYYLLGEVLERMQQPDRAKKYFLKAAKINSNYRNIKKKLGHT